MSAVFGFISLALITLILVIYLRESGFPGLGLIVSLTGGILFLLKLLPFFSELLSAVKEISAVSGLKTDYLSLVLKAVGLAYLGEFAGQLCRDAGEGSLASKIDLGTKAVIMVMALPLLKTILSTVISMFG